MTDTTNTSPDKTKEPAPAVEQQQTQEQSLAPDAKLKRTVGNKIYDWGIYTTFAWAGVAVMSLLSAHEAMHGKNPHFNWLRSLNNNVSSGLKKFLTKTMKNTHPETIDGLAKGSTMFVTLGLGGTAMMLPIKWLEDNRHKNACKIDNALGTTPPHPELIAQEIPQTWKSVLSGRMIAWGLSYVAFLGMGPKLTDKISKGFGKKFTDVFMQLRPTANAKNVRKWADIGAFDATFTVITASLTYLFSRIVAKGSNRTMDEEATLMTIDPATPTPFDPVYNDQPPLTQKTGEQPCFSEKHKPVKRQLVKSEPGLFSDKLAKGENSPAALPSLG